MNWFKNLKVGRKVLLCCLVFIAIIVVLSGMSFYITWTGNNSFHTFFNDRFVPARQLNRTARNILQIRINMLQEFDAAKRNDWKTVEERMKYTTELAEQYGKLLDDFSKTEMTVEEKGIFDDLMAKQAEVRTARIAFRDAIEAKNFGKAELELDVWLEKYRVFREVLDKLIVLQQTEADKLMQAQEDLASITYTMVVVFLIVSLIMGALITMLLARSVSGPVNKGLEFAKKLAAGDFTSRVDLDQKDELGMLGKELNTAADDLEQMVAEIIVASQNLVQAVQEISAGNENLSQRTSEQASSLEEIASTIEETTATINQNADNSVEASKLADQSSELAVEGGRVVSEAVSAINEINDSSKKIEEIISVINEIAFQTNLLALNAAVEAARAGEQGRGFAVVAGEVRNLAQRSGNAAKEIADLIKDSLVKVDRGTSLANKSGESLKEIIESIRNVGRYVAEIAAASREQKQGTDQINVAVTELDSMTQQNAGLVEETASASEEMANQAQELLAMMEKFRIRKETQSSKSNEKHREIHLRAADKSSKGSMVSRKAPVAQNAGGQSKATGTANKGKIEEILAEDGFQEF